jgi:hypothetical protein
MDVAKAVRGLSWFHRWTGVGLCLLFVLWFASGAILLFVPFPSLGDQDRLARGEPVNLAAVTAAPAEALAGGEALRLIAVGGRPVYVARAPEGLLRAVDAATGRPAAPIGAAQAGAIATRFGQAPVKAVSAPLRYDQWVAHNRFDAWRPFYRVSLADGEGTQLYVSAVTGEVVQRTRAGERAWNWGGAVIHWLYFTALRKSFSAWDQTVWWVSLLGLTTAVIGTVLGVYRTQKRLRGRRPDWSPFRGWLRWHHGLGLGVALFVLTWIFSGWLSMDHGRLFSRGTPAQSAEAIYHGAPLATALAGVAPADLVPLGSASQLTFDVVGGRPLASAEGGGPARVRLLDQPAAPVIAALPTALLAQAAGKAWPLASAAPRGPEASDQLYRTAEGMEARAVRFLLATPKDASVYLDPVSGRVIIVMDASRKAYAWVYYALHTFKFPGLIDRPILRKVLVLIPLLAGLAFSLTGLVVAVKRLRIAAA